MTKDVFISYGRRESLGFVGRLYQSLKLKGYQVWFDKVNIPDGDDYSKRIAHGIESAHNFILILAPRCLTSAYCLIELEYARKLGKRVIPIDQNVIFDTKDAPLSYDERSVLVQFYEANGMEVLPIFSKKDVLNRSHQLLGKTDWVHARQQLSEDHINQLHNWQLTYENRWRKHEEVDFIKENPIPIFGKDIDNFEDSFESILKVIETQKEYVELHTDLLQKALLWENNRRQTSLLLVGKERQEAQGWLTKNFISPEQPPCLPSVLHSEFITESKKNADNLMSEIFICFAPQEKKETEKLRKGLIKAGISVVLPNNSIHRELQKGFDYTEEIKEQIAQADNFVFVLSPSAIKNSDCLRELRFALTFHKRIIIVLAKEVKTEEVPESLRSLTLFYSSSYIDLTDNRTEDNFTENLDFEKDLSELICIVEDNYDYYRNHKRYLAQALKWEEQHQNDAILLRGHNLDKAQTWLQQGKTQGNNTTTSKLNTPTPLHEKFIEESIAKIGTLSSEVFISYSRTDGDFSRWLNEELQLNGRTTWFDQECIPAGSDFGLEIKNGIETSDNFLFIISPASISSPYCKEEVLHALSMGKRIILVRLQAVEKMPDFFPSHIQWIDFSKSELQNEFQVDNGQQFRELLRTLNTDREHTQKHSKYQQKALEWNKYEKNYAFLLRGNELAIAENWLEECKKHGKIPIPTVLQKEFISESVKSVNAQKRKQERTILRLRVFLTLSIIALLAACGLGLWVHSLNKKVKTQLTYLKTAQDSLIKTNKIEKLLKFQNYYQTANYQKSSTNYEEAIKNYTIALDFADSNQTIQVSQSIKEIETILPKKETFFKLIENGEESFKQKKFLEAYNYYKQADSIGYNPTLIKTHLEVLDEYVELEINKMKQNTLFLLEKNQDKKAYETITKALLLSPQDTSLLNLEKRVMRQMLGTEEN